MSELRSRGRMAGSFWRQNPVLVHLFGLSPLLAISTGASQGLAFGLMCLLVFSAAAVTVSLLGAALAGPWRGSAYLMVMAIYTTLVMVISQRYFNQLYLNLGIYLPLICCNFAMLVRLDECAGQRWSRGLVDTLKMSAGYLLVLLVMSGIREWILTGQLFANGAMLLPHAQVTVTPGAGMETGNGQFASLPAAALFLLGLLIAARNWLDSKLPSPTADSGEAVATVPRARVTGKLKGS